MAEIVTTVASTPSTFEVETAAGSGNFDIISNWAPSQVRISINDDGGGSFVDILSVGNLPLQITGYSYSDPKPPKHYIYSIDRSSYLYFKKNSSGYGTSGYLSMYYDGEHDTAYNWSVGSIPGNYVHLAGYYSAKHERFYLAYAFVDRLLENVTSFSVRTISDPDLIEGYKRIFYGIPAPETIKIKRENPVSPFFEYGQASILQYGIYSEDLRLADAIPTVDEFDAREGWSFDNSSKVLRYISGSNNQPVEVDGVYNGISYNLRDVFTPPTGSQPYNPGGNSSQGGGGGSFGKDENSVDITPSIPTGSAEQALGKAGLYTRYLLNRTELYTVGSILWSKNFLQGIEAALTKLFYASPADMLIQLLSYPFNIEGLSPSLGTSQFVWGNYPFATDISVVSVLNSPALQFDWGEVQLTEFWGSFLDYAPYTKIDLYLPFGIGFVPIDPNECIPGSIGVKTNFDMNTGAVIHTVTGKVRRNGTTTTVIIGTYCGNAARQVPLISADISGKMLNLISTGVGLVVGTSQAALAAEGPDMSEIPYYDSNTGLSGHIFGEGVNMSTGQFAAETFKSWSKQLPHTSGFKFATKSAMALSAPTPVQRNGSFTSGVSGLGIQFPYIVVSRPDQSVPQQYGHHYGYPSNIYAQLSTLTGYTEVGSIHLENLKCTGEERNELDRLLKGGVFLGY